MAEQRTQTITQPTRRRRIVHVLQSLQEDLEKVKTLSFTDADKSWEEFDKIVDRVKKTVEYEAAKPSMPWPKKTADVE